jgi:hypothetical protein
MITALGRYSVQAIALGILSLAASGCIVIPHPRNVAIAQGYETKKPKLDSIKTGQTTREDMTTLLGPFDTDASRGRFFWARWQQVKVQVEWFVGGCAQTGCGAAGGSERVWKIRNVLALFDEDGSVGYYSVCKETNVISSLKNIVSRLDPAPDVASDLVLPARHPHPLFSKYGHGRVIIENGTLSFEDQKEPEHNFGLSLSAVERLDAAHGSSPQILRLKLNLKRDKSPREFVVEASPAETVRLVALIESARR